MWLEDNLVVKYGFGDKEESLPRAINFFLALKGNLEATLTAVKRLQDPHKASLKENRYNPSPLLLTKVVKPNIVRLTQSEHSKGTSTQGPFEISDSE
ncbi:hypothetical protein G6F37_002843 [Rhizopus arrhizus]|nr:hypothetical protein G6F38_003927 [Rhizopus arrhizus]KAG1161697.1 hypothetical protein G6F37_002843 [Rhizopus arrhizus]